MRLNKPTRDAIDRHLPLYLELNDGAIEVRATTRQIENGNERSRKLYRGDIPAVFAFIKAVFELGGAVNVDDLPWKDFDWNMWNYRWSPELSPLKNELQDLWRNRPARQQPQW